MITFVIAFRKMRCFRSHLRFLCVCHIIVTDCRKLKIRMVGNLNKILPMFLELRNMDRQQVGRQTSFFVCSMSMYLVQRTHHNNISVTKYPNEDWLIVFASWPTVQWNKRKGNRTSPVDPTSQFSKRFTQNSDFESGQYEQVQS